MHYNLHVGMLFPALPNLLFDIYFCLFNSNKFILFYNLLSNKLSSIYLSNGMGPFGFSHSGLIGCLLSFLVLPSYFQISSLFCFSKSILDCFHYSGFPSQSFKKDLFLSLDDWGFVLPPSFWVTGLLVVWYGF